MEFEELKIFLDEKVDRYNNPNFIETDPIQIPHRFTIKEDIEISGFLVAIIAWGNRKSIINNGEKLMAIMGNSPFDFVMSASEKSLAKADNFVHRTFNNQDLHTFFTALKNIYKNEKSLENVFADHASNGGMQNQISHFKKVFFQNIEVGRTHKHISDPAKNSAAKRINMFLRWMVRDDNRGVDFGIWKTIPMSVLSCPLDVHSGGVARKLGLLNRTQNDGKAVTELDEFLRKLDANDPVKYDFALFGLGAFEKF